MILTRSEFTDYYESLQAGIAAADGPLWIPETFDNQKIRCRWFAKVRPIEFDKQNTLNEYWSWCKSTMRGEIRCFSCDNEGQEEWWGFTHKRDIVWWLARWSQ